MTRVKRTWDVNTVTGKLLLRMTVEVDGEVLAIEEALHPDEMYGNFASYVERRMKRKLLDAVGERLGLVQ